MCSYSIESQSLVDTVVKRQLPPSLQIQFIKQQNNDVNEVTMDIIDTGKIHNYLPLGRNFSKNVIETEMFPWRKCISKCQMQNGDNFVSVSMCKNFGNNTKKTERTLPLVITL